MDYDEHVLKEIEDAEVFVDDASVAQEITLMVFGLIGIAANILLIYIICRFTKLPMNIFLINWAIAQIGLTLSSISCFETVMAHLHVPESVMFVYYDLEIVLALVVNVFMMLLTAEWCLAAFLPRYIDKFKKYSHIIVACVWIFFTLYFISVAASSEASEHFYTFFMVIFAITFISIVVLHTVRIVQKCKGMFQYHSVVPLMIPTVFVLCWVLCWISLLLLLYFDIYVPVISWITDPPVFLHPVVNFVLLTALDQDYRTCFFEVTQACGLFKSRVQNRGGSNMDSEA